MDDIKNENISFEEAMKELQQLVGDLESGDAPLDKSLELFERGISLIKLCNGMLDSAEQKVTVLTQMGDEQND